MVRMLLKERIDRKGLVGKRIAKRTSQNNLVLKGQIGINYAIAIPIPIAIAMCIVYVQPKLTHSLTV